MAERVEETPVDLAGRGLKVMFVARPDACRACRTMQGRVFEPRQAPSLPLRECLTPPCRCRYEVYDPQAVVSRLLSAGVQAVKEGRLEQARELLYQVIDLDERNEKAWLWLSGVVPGVEERIICLENVLAINPFHHLAREGLRQLHVQRREMGTGPRAARKIRNAREAIEEIKSRHSKVAVLKQAPAPPIPGEGRPQLPTAGSDRSVGEPAKRIAEAERTPIGLSEVLLWVLIAAALLALIGTASLLVLSLAG